MPLYKTEAMILRSNNIGEADKLLTLFSREHGKIKAVAKGARRTTSKFGGRLEIFTYNSFLNATGKSLDIISQCETLESFYKTREDSGKLKAGVYFIKLVDLTTEERQQNEELFDLLLSSLLLLQGEENIDRLSRYFEVKLIEVEGLFPDLNKLHCSKSVKDSILSLKHRDFSKEINKDVLRQIEKLFKGLISSHIGRDISKMNIGSF